MGGPVKGEGRITNFFQKIGGANNRQVLLSEMENLQIFKADGEIAKLSRENLGLDACSTPCA